MKNWKRENVINGILILTAVLYFCWCSWHQKNPIALLLVMLMIHFVIGRNSKRS